jgi:hypothetical protein
MEWDGHSAEQAVDLVIWDRVPNLGNMFRLLKNVRTYRECLLRQKREYPETSSHPVLCPSVPKAASQGGGSYSDPSPLRELPGTVPEV